MSSGEPPPIDTTPRWGTAGIHGIPRQRQWDAVASAEVPGLPGRSVSFVVLPDGSLIVEADLPEGALTPLAEALEGQLEPPYRAEAVRREGDVWAVAARKTDVVELRQPIAGDVVDITVSDGERTTLVDGEPSWWHISELERLGEERSDSYTIRAERLDDVTWEVRVFAL